MKLRPWERCWENTVNEDFLRERISHPSRIMIADEAAEFGGLVVDVGCATCNDYGFHLERGLRYIGIDLTPKFLRHARTRFPVVDTILASALHLPLRKGSCQTAYCRGVLAHMHPDDWPDAVREMWMTAEKLVIVCLIREPLERDEKPTKYLILPLSSPSMIPSGPMLTKAMKAGRATWLCRINRRSLVKLIEDLSGSAPTTKKSPKIRNARIHWLFFIKKIRG